MAIKLQRQESMDDIRQEVMRLMIVRLLAFSDIINRFLHLRVKDYDGWISVNALLLIQTRGHLTPSQLAKLTLRAPNNITKLVDGLEQQGLIRRIHNKSDRRIISLVITQEGLDYTLKYLQGLLPMENELKQCLGLEDLQTLVTLSRTLRLNLVEEITGARIQTLK